jgi:hypothetical protein
VCVGTYAAATRGAHVPTHGAAAPALFALMWRLRAYARAGTDGAPMRFGRTGATHTVTTRGRALVLTRTAAAGAAAAPIVIDVRAADDADDDGAAGVYESRDGLHAADVTYVYSESPSAGANVALLAQLRVMRQPHAYGGAGFVRVDYAAERLSCDIELGAPAAGRAPLPIFDVFGGGTRGDAYTASDAYRAPHWLGHALRAPPHIRRSRVRTRDGQPLAGDRGRWRERDAALDAYTRVPRVAVARDAWQRQGWQAAHSALTRHGWVAIDHVGVDARSGDVMPYIGAPLHAVVNRHAHHGGALHALLVDVYAMHVAGIGLRPSDAATAAAFVPRRNRLRPTLGGRGGRVVGRRTPVPVPSPYAVVNGHVRLTVRVATTGSLRAYLHRTVAAYARDSNRDGFDDASGESVYAGSWLDGVPPLHRALRARIFAARGLGRAWLPDIELAIVVTSEHPDAANDGGRHATSARALAGRARKIVRLHWLRMAAREGLSLTDADTDTDARSGDDDPMAHARRWRVHVNDARSELTMRYAWH